VTALLVATLISAAVGCSERVRLVDTFKWLPAGYGQYAAWDTKEVRNDPIREMLAVLLGPPAERMDWIGIDSDQVDYFAFATDGAGHEVDIMVGGIDASRLRLLAEQEGFGRGVEMGVETGTGTDEGDSCALVPRLDERTLYGTDRAVRDCTRVIKGVDGSVCESRDVADVLDRMPDSMIIILAVGESEDHLPDCLAEGISIERQNSEELGVTVVLKYSNEDIAEVHRIWREDNLAEEALLMKELRSFEASREGAFVEVRLAVTMAGLETILGASLARE
jgi:hypothetical protein